MEEIRINIGNKFATDIQSKAREIYSKWRYEVQNDLKDCNDNDYLKYLSYKQIEIRNKLFESDFKDSFYLSAIETNLIKSLEKYFRGLDISQATEIEYINFNNTGDYAYVAETRKIYVHPLKQIINSQPYFKFGEIDRFKALAEYIAWGLFYLELKREFDQYNGLQIYHQEQELPKIIPTVEVNNEGINTNSNNNEENNKIKSNKKSDTGLLIKPKTTIDFLIGSETEKQLLLDFLLKTYSGKKGKSIALMIHALKENELIAYVERSELYKALRVDFGVIGSDTGINNFWSDVQMKDKEFQKLLALHKKRIQDYKENLPKQVA